MIEALRYFGITRLYKFQYQAVEAARRRVDHVIVSGTGTGKTEAFLTPILDEITQKGPGLDRPYALILYPTKALARDQLYRIKVLAEGKLGIRVAVLDGDTPRSDRVSIYSDPPHILVSNPDMVHVGLAMSDRFRRLVSSIEVVVLDEIHVYRGVFGSHVRWVLHRLRESASGFTAVGAGATLGNPGYIASKLFGREVRVIEGPRRRKGAALHLLVDYGYGSRWSTTASIISLLARRGLKVLGFVDSQQMAELIARIARKSYGVMVGVHRAGLMPEDRRRVEEGFKEGRIKAVVATPTMELGIDLGDLDAVVMAHLPRSISSYIQRAGRAGRRDRPGLVVTVMGDDPIEAYFLSKPRELFSMKPDPGYIEPGNREITRIHLAALLLQRGMVNLNQLPPELAVVAGDLKVMGLAVGAGDRLIPRWSRLRDYLEAHGGLRSSGPQVRIIESGKEIGRREMPMALYDLYPGAVYYHGGKTYVSTKLDIEAMRAEVRRVDASLNFYTKPMYSIDVVEISPLEDRTLGPLRLVYADVKILMTVEGYYVKDEYSGATLSEVAYKEPLKWIFWTKGVATRYPNPGITDEVALISGYHALEHTIIAAARPVVGASDTDLGGVSYPSGHIVIYDSAPGGHGASKLVYERLERIHDIAENILTSCTCEDGCPKCVFSPYCGVNNRFLSRKTALKILDYTTRAIAKPPKTIQMPEGNPYA
ncbi:MAG: DEAD/DEAH box helicase [Desulfurococcales archaeon]|nr:DEAD/DEAH box helicase [Desulfurococcales archaeon]